jgi:hypothetical protein
MNRRVSWWLCLGVLGGLLGVLPSARAQSGDPADLEAPEWEEGEDHPATLETVEPVQPEAESVPSEPQPEYQGPVGDDERMAPRPATATEPASDEPAAAVSERRVEPFLFEVGAIGGLLYHRLTYRDDLYGFMNPYSLANAKEVGGYLSAYPLARADMGVLGQLGVELRYTHMITFDSQRSDGSSFPTRSRELVAGLRFRLACDALLNRGIDASVGFGGGGQTFDIGSAVALPNVDNRAAVPSRHYRFLRVDAATRIALDLGFFVAMHIGVRMITSAGDVDREEWFPHGRRWGLESGLQLGYVLPKDLELSVGFEAQRYMYRLRPQPGDSNVVGGLLDRYVHAQVRAGWRF